MGEIYVTELEEYYNKFNEEKRLNSRHGRVEFITSMKYIHDCLADLMNGNLCDDLNDNFNKNFNKNVTNDDTGNNMRADIHHMDTESFDSSTDEELIRELMAQRSKIKILDVGAGTGRYSVPLAEEGYDVTALELVKHNLGRLKQKSDKVKAYQGNATKLKKFGADEFDLTLVFGPM